MDRVLNMRSHAPEDEPPGEERLVEKARLRDEGAMRSLIRRNNQKLYRIARALSRDASEAEEIVQETYVRAFSALDGYRGDALFSTWLGRIAINEAYSRRRRQRTTVGLEEVDVSNAHSSLVTVATVMGFQEMRSPEHEAGRDEVRAILERAVEELPEDFRIVFVLRDVQGLSGAETASLVGIRAETVKTRLHRARRLIRRALERRLFECFDDLFPFGGRRCARVTELVIARMSRARPG